MHHLSEHRINKGKMKFFYRKLVLKEKLMEKGFRELILNFNLPMIELFVCYLCFFIYQIVDIILHFSIWFFFRLKLIFNFRFKRIVLDKHFFYLFFKWFYFIIVFCGNKLLQYIFRNLWYLIFIQHLIS